MKSLNNKFTKYLEYTILRQKKYFFPLKIVILFSFNVCFVCVYSI
uniref:Uncharacterized protein n=1 Tax=viral metagenome TaxID=1070528 RepID=A0A6C0JPR4_9ZZZZ